MGTSCLNLGKLRQIVNRNKHNWATLLQKANNFLLSTSRKIRFADSKVLMLVICGVFISLTILVLRISLYGSNYLFTQSQKTLCTGSILNIENKRFWILISSYSIRTKKYKKGVCSRGCQCAVAANLHHWKISHTPHLERSILLWSHYFVVFSRLWASPFI